MGMLKEFREFAIKGNVVDLAVGVVVGAAFGKMVSSLVADMITPVLGLLVGGVDFKQLKVGLKDALGAQPAVTLNYGIFIQTIFDFVIIAGAIFLLVRAINRLTRQVQPAAAPAPAAPSREVELLMEIRDALR